nr:DUF1919 domain-containing protein [Arenibacter sp. F26102]
MFRDLEFFIRRKTRYCFRVYFAFRDRCRLKNNDFGIISNNCWGGCMYQWLGLPYNSPFVGLFLYGPCYIKLLNRFDYYLRQELDFKTVSKYKDREIGYPMAFLDDIEVHFTHYDSKEEALRKWNRRKERLLKNDHQNWFFMICDRERVDDEIIKEFHQLPFKNKVSFGLDAVDGLDNHQHIKVPHRDRSKQDNVPHGRKLFQITFMFMDVIHWLDYRRLKRTRFKA